jgi:hypothetical protein
MKNLAIAVTCASLAVLAVAPLRPALAQANVGNSALPSKPAQKAPVTPPDALPGARVDKDRVTPADRGIADMKPTDAISRGADLQGHNLLGMTPLELSVDLGRNDITFLILSYRGIDGALPKGPTAGTRAAARPTRAEARRAAQAAAPPPRPAAPAPAARSYASDGGTPVPSAGFLGFGN